MWVRKRVHLSLDLVLGHFWGNHTHKKRHLKTSLEFQWPVDVEHLQGEGEDVAIVLQHEDQVGGPDQGFRQEVEEGGQLLEQRAEMHVTEAADSCAHRCLAAAAAAACDS